ncbi:pentatricopeptide repeat-containing protein chloroplastic-like [Dorcoceras hygrometricum]|uniref:Pentatricopeptide repeat-containing protein chloroplastic-like n=1 Tax=Dorcoceras hygrometricum TaxID=472368 RepID=A0A2Z7CWV1_9LAMI|nr:pentatricopeptide repeat-containing protein chloroplastic-like [Dorcoceras hygrometricum]
MSDALSIIASPAVFPPSGAPPLEKGRKIHRRSSGKSLPNPNRNPKPQYTSTPPLLSSSRLDKRRSLVYYAELASKLAEDGRFEDFFMVSESMVASGVNASEFSALLNGKSVARGVAKMIREGKLDSIVERVFNGTRRLNIVPVQLFDGIAVDAMRGECGQLLKCGNVDRVVDLMESLHGFQFPIQKLVEPSDILNLCIKKRNPVTAIRFAQIFPHMEILFCTVILEFGKKGDLMSALKAFEASKQNLDCISMHVYRTIIDVCGLCGDYLKSRTIFEELLSTKVTPNTYVFNSLMNVNAGDLHYTMNIYKHMRVRCFMQKLGLTADIASHNILLKSCCLAAKVELAQDIYKEIRDLESKGVLKLDVFTYSTMIKVFADAKMWKRALEIKEDMTASGVIPNTITWSSLINACANAGLVEQVVKLFEEMLLAGGQPNSQCVNILLHACVEACQFDRAFRLFRCWKESGFHQTATVHNQDKTEEFLSTDQMKRSSMPYRHLIMKILSSMHETGIQPDVVTYTTAIKVCVKHNDPKLAFSLFAEMKKYQVKPNMVTYNTILRARSRYGSLQEVQQCLTIYQDMRKAGYKSNDYYLKQLIEEWCEGVIQNRKMANDQWCSQRTNFRPHSILLEKVAEHLQENNADSLSIDLRGLTKVEARIVVLAVLRKIREKNVAGESVKDDILIILGVQELYEDGNGIREAVIRLLHYDLGLQVLSFGSRTWNDERKEVEDRNMRSEVHEDSSLPPASRSPSRRPVALQRLKVTRESLQHWLQRRLVTPTK